MRGTFALILILLCAGCSMIEPLKSIVLFGSNEAPIGDAVRASDGATDDENVIIFAADHSIGHVSFHTAGEWLPATRAKEAEARGAVTIPAGRELVLTPNEQTIRDLGAELASLPASRVYLLDLAHPSVDDGVVQTARRHGSRFRALNLRKTKITDDALEALAEMRLIKELYLSDTAITDAGLLRLAGSRQLQVLELARTDVTCAGLAELAAAPSLKRLDLSLTRIDDDDGAKHLADLTALEELRLAFTRFGDIGLSNLRDMASLRTLVLTNTLVTDAGLVNLGSLRSLRSLDLAGCGVSDAGLDYLMTLPSIANLSLARTPITDAGLAKLGQLNGRLESLDLSETSITDFGLAHLRSLESLGRLALDNTQIGDAALGHLKELGSLRDLSLRGTKISDAGLAQLSAALPECVIIEPNFQ